MGGSHQGNKILPRSKPWVHLEEVLDAVPVIGIQEGCLFEYRADPDRCNAQALQVADLGRKPVEITSHELASGIFPLPPAGLGGGGIATVAFRIRWRRSAAYELVIVVAIPLLVAIGKAVEHQKIKHLVFPGMRGWEKGFVKQILERYLLDRSQHLGGFFRLRERIMQ